MELGEVVRAAESAVFLFKAVVGVVNVGVVNT